MGVGDMFKGVDGGGEVGLVLRLCCEGLYALHDGLLVCWGGSMRCLLWMVGWLRFGEASCVDGLMGCATGIEHENE